MAWFLLLHSSSNKTDDSSRFLLAPDTDPDEVQRVLEGAGPAQFVSVPIQFQDDVATVQLRVQPHLYGAWAVYEMEAGPGESPPQRAARGRQPNVQEARHALGQLGGLFRPNRGTEEPTD